MQKWVNASPSGSELAETGGSGDWTGGEEGIILKAVKQSNMRCIVFVASYSHISYHVRIRFKFSSQSMSWVKNKLQYLIHAARPETANLST